jgi:hypothetical protein
MKKLLVLLMAMVMLLTFTACGSDEKTEDGSKESTSGSEEKGESSVYDVGHFSASVPAGWKAFPIKDLLGENPDAPKPDLLQIAKDAESEMDLFTNPYIKFAYFSKDITMVKMSKDYYPEGADIEPIKAGPYTWEGFRATVNENTLIVLYAVEEATGAQFQAEIWQKVGDKEISLTDADVLEILGSVKEAK